MNKILFIISFFPMLIAIFSGCTSQAPSGYIDFEDSVILSRNETYIFEGTKYVIQLKDVEEEKCVLYLFGNDELIEKHFFENDDNSQYDFAFGDYKVRFISGTKDYAKLSIFIKEK